MSQMSEVRQCDFCGQFLEDDEELTPVFVGEPSDPPTERFQEVVRKKSRREYLLGHTVAEWIALWRTLENADSIDVSLSDRVLEPDFAGSPEEIPDKFLSFESEVNEDRAAAEVRVTTPEWDPEPDLKVCGFCVASFEE